MSEHSIQLFEHENWKLRTAVVNGEPWFVARDVTGALGLDRTAARRLDDDEKGVYSTHTPGGDQEVSVVSEPGLYSLVLASRKPEAKAFKRWVTHEVIPAIRRQGGYMVARPDETDEQVLARAVLIANSLLERLKDENAQLMSINADLLPRAKVYNQAIAADGSMSVTKAANYCHQYDGRVTRGMLFAQFKAHGFMCKEGHAPTRRGIDSGYLVQMFTVRSDGTLNAPYSHVTPKGLDWCLRNICNTQASKAEVERRRLYAS